MRRLLTVIAAVGAGIVFFPSGGEAADPCVVAKPVGKGVPSVQPVARSPVGRGVVP